MSLGRTILRDLIRATAPPALLIYVVYKMWLQLRDKPLIISTVESYRKLYRKLHKKIVTAYLKAKEQRHDQDEWSYKA